MMPAVEQSATTTTTTCIVGLVHEGAVYIGADSAGVNGWLERQVRLDEKVFIKGDMIFGFTSSFRMGQILRYSFSPPDQYKKEDDYKYLCGRWVDALMECLKQKGYAWIDNNRVWGGEFLLGFNGKLYRVENNFQVGRREEPFDAVGCGEPLALGALHIMEKQKLGPRQKIKRALEAAERFSAGVKGPFNILRLKA